MSPRLVNYSRGLQTRERAFMLKKRRCPHCRHLFVPDPRLKERQKTCGREECCRNQKRQSNKEWQSLHPDYYRGIYPQQKEAYGTRAEYKKRYRKRNPEYVRRNAAFVKKHRERFRKAPANDVSHTSCDLQLSVWKETGNIAITHVSHTSRDIFVTVSQNEA
jgi:hypothetical protein